jgi:hypothetical protein
MKPSELFAGSASRSVIWILEGVFVVSVTAVQTGKILESLEAWILQRLGGNGKGFTMPAYPSGDPLAKPDSEMIDEVGMWILRCAKNQLIVF